MNFGKNIGTKAEPAVTVFTNPANQGAMIRKAAQAYPVTKLPLSKLRVNEPDSKMSYPGNRLNIMGMVDTIKKGGELPPIIVVPKNFNYMILDGHHRYTAYKMAGIDEVPVKILDPKDVKYTDIVDPTLARTTNEDQDDYEIHNYKKLDRIMSKLCDLVEQGQASGKDYGMVAAAVLDPDNQIVARLNRPGRDGKRIHAEHAAILDYHSKHGSIPEGSIIITTLSPCNEHLDERDGPSCTELINNSTVKKVYCGYMDPTQDDDTRQFTVMETANKELRNRCKEFADTFLDDVEEDAAGVGTITKQNSTCDVNKGTPRKNLKAFRLI
jgi:pyrimidine deaminase RibD-like protein